MKQNEYAAFIERVFAMASFYKEKTSDFMFEIWWAALKDYDYDSVTKAMTRYATSPDSGVFMPKPADIVRLLVGTSSEASELAWGKVYQAMARAGRWNDVCFDDPLIHLVIEDMGGWVKVCMADGDITVATLHKQFVAAYAAYRQRGAIGDYSRVLTGVSNAQNRINGFRVAPPMLIGDPDKAKAVLQNGSSSGALRITQAKETTMQNVAGLLSARKQDS